MVPVFRSLFNRDRVRPISPGHVDRLWVMDVRKRHETRFKRKVAKLQQKMEQSIARELNKQIS